MEIIKDRKEKYLVPASIGHGLAEERFWSQSPFGWDWAISPPWRWTGRDWASEPWRRRSSTIMFRWMDRWFPISVVQISSEEGGIVLEKVVDEGAHVNKGDVIELSNSNLDLEILNAESEPAEKQDMLRNTQISMEQDRLNNSNEELSLSQDVITKRRSYQHQRRCTKKNSIRARSISRQGRLRPCRQEACAISKRLKKDAQLRRSQMDQMGDNLEAMQKNVQLVRQRKEKRTSAAPFRAKSVCSMWSWDRASRPDRR